MRCVGVGLGRVARQPRVRQPRVARGLDLHDAGGRRDRPITCAGDPHSRRARPPTSSSPTSPPRTPAGTACTNTVDHFLGDRRCDSGKQSGTAGTTVINAAPDLAIAKSHSGNAQQGQIGFVYTLGVSNVSTVQASGTTTVQDTLPPGMTATGNEWRRLDLYGRDGELHALRHAGRGRLVPVDQPDRERSRERSEQRHQYCDRYQRRRRRPLQLATDPTVITTVASADLTITKTTPATAARPDRLPLYDHRAERRRLVDVGHRNRGRYASGRPDGEYDQRQWMVVQRGRNSDLFPLGRAGLRRNYPPITLTVNVSSSAPATVTNTATVSGGGDTNPANDSASDPTTVTPQAVGADLAITKTHVGDARAGQIGFTYRDHGEQRRHRCERRHRHGHGPAPAEDDRDGSERLRLGLLAWRNAGMLAFRRARAWRHLSADHADGEHRRRCAARADQYRDRVRRRRHQHGQQHRERCDQRARALRSDEGSGCGRPRQRADGDRAALRQYADFELQRAARGPARRPHRRPVRDAVRLVRTESMHDPRHGSAERSVRSELQGQDSRGLGDQRAWLRARPKIAGLQGGAAGPAADLA